MLAVAMLGFLAAGTAQAIVPHEEVLFGSNQAAFLLQTVQAREAALGEAFTAVADDPSAVIFNPGGLSGVLTPSISVMADRLVPGTSVSAIAGAGPLGPGNAGIELVALRYGSYDVRDSAGNLTGTDSPGELALAAGYGIVHPEWLGIPGATGVAVEIIHEPWGGPLGAANVGSVIPLGGGLAFGWSARHLAVPRHGATLPGSIQAGAAYVHPEWLRITFDAGYPILGQRLSGAVGLEATPERHVALRLGYRSTVVVSELGSWSGFSAGVGFTFAGLSLDYAFRPYGDLTTSHLVSLLYAFAPAPPPAAQ